MIKRINIMIILLFIFFIFSFILIFISQALVYKAKAMYDENHISRIELEDHIQYSKLIHYEEVSSEWSNLEKDFFNILTIAYFLNAFSVIGIRVSGILIIILYLYKLIISKKSNNLDNT